MNCSVFEHVKNTKEANIPEKRIFNGHEFKLFFVSKNRSRTKGRAGRCRKHSFNTRVIEIYPGIYVAYRRQKRVNNSGFEKNSTGIPIRKSGIWQGVKEAPEQPVG